jgi:hypothetical protein
MRLKILDRFDQAFGINLFRLLDDCRLFQRISVASCHYASLGFRIVSLIYFHALPPLSLETWFTCVTHSRGAFRYTAADIQAEFEAAESKARPSLVEVVCNALKA